MTEDMIEEYASNMQSSDDNVHIESRAQFDILLSDMQAFKVNFK